MNSENLGLCAVTCFLNFQAIEYVLNKWVLANS